MRPPMSKLSPQDRATLKSWYLYGICTYSLIILVLVAMVGLKTDRVQSALTKLVPSGDAVAAGGYGSPSCAGRDLKLVTQIEELGEARAVPGDQLAAAYFTMMDARQLCSSGREAEALAVYDGITIVPVKSATK